MAAVRATHQPLGHTAGRDASWLGNPDVFLEEVASWLGSESGEDLAIRGRRHELLLEQ